MTSLVRQIVLIFTCMLLVLAAARAQTPVTDCDRLAAHPDDPKKTANGVVFAELDADKAVAACRDAVQKYGSDPRNIYQLGRAYEKGGDVSQANELYRMSARHGYAMAAYILGLMYIDGKIEGAGVDEAKQEAERLLRFAADAGIPRARLILGYRLMVGVGVRKDIHAAEDILKPLAEAGSPRAQNGLGLLYAGNNQFTDHSTRAVHWYERATSQGYPPAQYQLALHLISGDGVTKDVGRGVALITASANQGYPEAQSRLGQMYLVGKFVEKDRDRAFKLLEDAAVHGNQDAQKIVGSAYQSIIAMQTLGAPIPTFTSPPPEGFEVLAGTAYGRNSLQMMKYLRRMADAGDGDANATLAYFYELGRNVSKDRNRAAGFYRRAIALGFAKAKEALEKLEASEQ